MLHVILQLYRTALGRGVGGELEMMKVWVLLGKCDGGTRSEGIVKSMRGRDLVLIHGILAG